MPGTYSVSLAKRVGGKLTPLHEPQTFEAVALGLGALPAADRAALLDFQRKTARLQRAVQGAVRAAAEARTHIDHIKKGLDATPRAGADLMDRARDLETRLKDLQVHLSGDSTQRRRNEPTSPSISQRVQRIVYSQWTSTSPPTGTNRDAYRHAAAEFGPVLGQLRRLIEVELRSLEDSMEVAESPWTPGRLPRWSPEVQRNP